MPTPARPAALRNGAGRGTGDSRMQRRFSSSSSDGVASANGVLVGPTNDCGPFSPFAEWMVVKVTPRSQTCCRLARSMAAIRARTPKRVPR